MKLYHDLRTHLSTSLKLTAHADGYYPRGGDVDVSKMWLPP